MTKPNDKKPWNPKCYNCNKQGHIAKDCRQPKKLPWKPVAERPRQVNTISKAPHASLSWTGCYDNDCRIHLEDKEMSGHYPSNNNPGRSRYDMTVPDTRPRTLAMMQTSNSKIARKPKEQLNEMLRVQRFEPIEESDEEPDHQYDPLEEQRLLTLTSSWDFGEPESGFDSDGIPYESDSPTDVANWNARHYNEPIPGINDSSSEEDLEDQGSKIKQLLKYQEVNMLQDEQQRYFYGTSANQRERDYTPQLHTEDHPALRNIHHRLHRTLFWPQCFHDKCKEHMGDKHDYRFYPRKQNDEPIPQIYTTSQMIGWTMVFFEDNVATFQPSPQFPMRCQHDNNMKWDECQQDECQVHYQEKARAWRIMKDGPRPPQIRIRENSVTKARREGKQITYPGSSEQSKN
ncbi:hypothetical protein CCHR01_19570 [Colletotrichum chrysophilum]|uniref:CCHC-type domain-containing protein n=1 Tax=Colletotrichum chrysophilum TaxID=1836956 RepID=A0AAD9E510_9PEZI|nr:hypothetical protein CCHR01_19570 [Colletotrichum chrysophilum]